MRRRKERSPHESLPLPRLPSSYTQTHNIAHSLHTHMHALAQAGRLFVSETLVVWDRRAETSSSSSSPGREAEAALR